MNPFTVLSVPESLCLESSELEQAFQKASKQCHPDAGGSEEEFGAVRRAYDRLKSPGQRIRAVLTLHQLEWDKRGSVPGEVMDLFGRIADTIQKVDDFIKERSQARSGLGKAVLDAKVPQLQQEVESVRETLIGVEEDFVSRFTQFEERGWEDSASEMAEVARGLAFLEKWQVQVRGATGKLFEALLAG